MHNSASPLLTLDHISLGYNGREVLDDISLHIHAGEILMLIGPNGAGKSSLARIALGLIKPDRGKRIAARQLAIGYVPQSLHIDASLPLTVDRFLWLAKSSSRQQRLSMLKQVGASELIDQQLVSLSGGEKQRVLLARALLRRPRLLVLDEPDQALDVSGQASLYQLLAKVAEQTGCALLVISHDLHWVMAAADRVVCLNGHICCQGAPDSIRQHSAFTALFGEHSNNQKVPIAPYRHHHADCQDSHQTLPAVEDISLV